MTKYILSYDFATAASLQDQLAAFVKANRYVTQWVQPYHGCYLLKSNVDLVTLATSFNEFFAGRVHIITPISPTATTGILPQYMWDWLNRPETNLNALLQNFGVPPSSS